MKLLNLLPKKNGLMFMSLGLLASATLFSSCLKNDSEDYQGPVSGISFVHAAANQPSVGLFIDGRGIFNEAIKYTDFSKYLTAGSGKHLVQTTVGGTTQRLSEATITLAEGKYHTVFVAHKAEDDSLTTVMTTDDLTAPATGKAKVRFVQLSPGSDDYDLYLQGGQKLADSRAYKESSTFVEIDPATKLKFAVRLAGAAEDAVVTSEVDVTAKRFYTVVLAGKASVAAGASGELKAFVVEQ